MLISIYSSPFRLECKLLFVAAQIGPKKLHTHIKYVRQRGSETVLRLLVTLDETAVGQETTRARSYYSFLRSSERSNSEEVQRAADLVTPEDVVNLQFTSGRLHSKKI